MGIWRLCTDGSGSLGVWYGGDGLVRGVFHYYYLLLVRGTAEVGKDCRRNLCRSLLCRFVDGEEYLRWHRRYFAVLGTCSFC
jgi:hypothetical protein